MRPWRIVSLGILAASPLLVALMVARGTTRSIDVSKLPPTGFQVAESAAELLPEGGMLLVLSSVCQTCKDRAKAFAEHVAGKEATGIVVFETEATWGTSLVRRRVEAVLGARSRTVFLPYAEMEHLIGGSVVPIEVTVDGSNRVLASGSTSIGWLGAALSPRNWLRGWQSAVRRIRRTRPATASSGLTFTLQMERF
jgi:hypothetical protein